MMRRSTRLQGLTAASLAVVLIVAAPADAQQVIEGRLQDGARPVAAKDSAVRLDTVSIVRATPAAPAAPAAPAKPKLTNVVTRPEFSVEITGRLQALYQLVQPDAETNEKTSGFAYTDRPTVETTSLMRIRRGRVGFEGIMYAPDFQYNVQLELAGQSMSLKRAFVNWKARGSALQLRGGKFKVPFGRQQLTSIFTQQAVDRSLVSDEFAKGDDDGFMVWGTPVGGRVEYYAGVFNGEGNNRNSQQDSRNQWAGRVVWSPLGKLTTGDPALGNPRFLFSVGANANRNGGWLVDVNGVAGIQAPKENRDPATGYTVDHGDDAAITIAGVDAAWKWRRLSWSGEYFARQIDPVQSGLEMLRARGWYTQLGGFVATDRVEVGARYGQLDPNLDRPELAVREVTPFVNIYLKGNDLKLQTDVSVVRTGIVDRRYSTATDVVGTQLDDRRLRTQLTVTF